MASPVQVQLSVHQCACCYKCLSCWSEYAHLKHTKGDHENQWVILHTCTCGYAADTERDKGFRGHGNDMESYNEIHVS